jgi:hypothetical protein
MADFSLPEVGQDLNAWGPKLNGTLQHLKDIADGVETTRTGERPVGQGELVVNVHDHGAVGDGAVNDAAAIQAAAAVAVAANAPLALTRKTTYLVESQIVFPDGIVIHANGATLRRAAEANQPTAIFGDDSTIVGTLRFSTVGPQARGVALLGDRIRADRIVVVNDTAGAGAADNLQVGVRISGSDIEVGSVEVANYDYSATVQTSSRVRIGHVLLSTYVRGLYISDSKDVTVSGGLIHTPSPNATTDPGHNGILIDSAAADDATEALRLENITVRDAGEHGIRFGGSKRVRNVWLTDIHVSNVGQCGVKFLAGTAEDHSLHENIEIDGLVAEDCGTSEGASMNTAGLLLRYVKNVIVRGLIVRKRGKSTSASEGVGIAGATNVLVQSPILLDTQYRGFAVHPDLGDNTSVKIVGGLIVPAAGYGVYFESTGTSSRRVEMLGFTEIQGATTANVNVVGGGIIGVPRLEWQSVTSNTTLQIIGSSSVWRINCQAPSPVTLPVVREGSVWQETNGSYVTYLREGSLWKALGKTDLIASGTLAWDPGSIASGAGETSPNVTVTGAALGDYVQVAAPGSLQGLIAQAYVTAANTVAIRLSNLTGGAVDLGSGTWKARVVGR